MTSLIPLVVLLPLFGAIANGLFGHRLPRPFVSFVACGVVFVSFLLSVWAFVALHGDPSTTGLKNTLYTWFASGNARVEVTFLVDRLSSVMILVVTGVGFLIHLYSVGYMAHDPSLARYFAYLNLFTFAMLTLVLADSLPLMFLGWEGVGLCSYLLIGFWFTETEKAAAGKKAFVVNRIGDFGFLVAMMLLLRFAGTLNIDQIHKAVTAGSISVALATGVCLMLFLGATGKSAQLPLYVWLPDAMAGPTPVSALIHAATMVTAGVYMVARMGFLFSIAPIAMLTVALVGAATALFAATIGTAQNDIKKVLAYSTVSQLGFMFIAAGVGAYAIAIFHLATHAFFKACLFLGSGSVIHGMSGEQDIRQMGGLRRKMPITFWTFFLATLAITGFPLTAGFISKDAILWSAFAADMGKFADVFGGGTAKVLWTIGALSAGCTAFYMWRLVYMTFFSGELRARPEVRDHVHESPWTMTLPLGVLALLSMVGGALCWPPLFGGHEGLVEWLAPVLGHLPLPEGEHQGLEIGTMAAAFALALFGFAVATVMYARRIHPAVATFIAERPWRWLYLRLAGKWHVDELYETTVIQPLCWGSRVVLYEGLDKRVIDGSVNLVGWLSRKVGFLGQLFQSGNIQRYLAIFAVGVAILLYGWLTPSRPTSIEPAPAKPTAAVQRLVPAAPALPGIPGGGR
ncbi:MAG: NADH-quinone oxidoreductase subunit L [Deltaproteobacteria bacterium]|nr:NADH-quinone oxidoreductase subunit L [Deltaproteobacteria bacterium]